jgi:hypothetical protein
MPDKKEYLVYRHLEEGELTEGSYMVHGKLEDPETLISFGRYLESNVSNSESEKLIVWVEEFTDEEFAEIEKNTPDDPF